MRLSAGFKNIGLFGDEPLDPEVALQMEWLAYGLFKKLKQTIRLLEEELPETTELQVVIQSPVGPVVVEEFGFQNPWLICAHGIDQDGNECGVNVHINCLSLALQRVPRESRGERDYVRFSDEQPATHEG